MLSPNKMRTYHPWLKGQSKVKVMYGTFSLYIQYYAIHFHLRVSKCNYYITTSIPFSSFTVAMLISQSPWQCLYRLLVPPHSMLWGFLTWALIFIDDVLLLMSVCPLLCFIVYLLMLNVLAGAIKFPLWGINKVISYLILITVQKKWLKWLFN